MVITPAFQVGDGGSIPSGRSTKPTKSTSEFRIMVIIPSFQEGDVGSIPTIRSTKL